MQLAKKVPGCCSGKTKTSDFHGSSSAAKPFSPCLLSHRKEIIQKRREGVADSARSREREQAVGLLKVVFESGLHGGSRWTTALVQQPAATSGAAFCAPTTDGCSSGDGQLQQLNQLRKGLCCLPSQITAAKTAT